MALDAIFFDLDGTLTDPKPGITRSIQYALQKLDHPTVPTEDELTWCIGPPLRASFVKILGGEDHADRAVAGAIQIEEAAWTRSISTSTAP